MKHAPIVIAALLACGMAMSPDAISAGPRESLRAAQAKAPETPEEVRARKTQEMEAWLRRLIGSFKMYSGVTSSGILRWEYFRLRRDKRPEDRDWGFLANCAAIGSGPGVHCMFGSFEQGEDQPVVGAQRDFQRAGMIIQFGINANASEIQILMAWADTGLVAESSAKLRDDRVEWRWPCAVKIPGQDCTQTMRITAPADGEYIVDDGAVSIGSSLGIRVGQTYWVPFSTDESGATDVSARISLPSDYLDQSKRLRRPR